MKVCGDRNILLNAFQLASAAVPTRDTNPILRNVKAVAREEGLTLSATDLEQGLRLEVSGFPVEESGKVLLPSSRTLAILREAPDEELAIEATTHTAFVKGAANEFEMSCEDAESYPDIPEFGDDKYHELPAGSLRDMIRRTVFAAAAESSRYIMTGVLWELDNTKIQLVATDGRRLAMCEAVASCHGDHSTTGKTCVVPSKAMQLLERNLHDPDELVRVSFRSNEVLFWTGRATVYSRLSEGRYPNYREVVPKKSPVKVPLTVGPLLTALRQAAIMAEDNHRVVMQFGGKKLVLHAQGPETGRSQVELPVDYAGKTLKIAFDAKLLTDMLRVLPADTSLSLEMTTGQQPALFRCGDDYAYVVMPLT